MPAVVTAMRAGEWFKKIYGQQQKHLVAAPGRVNLIGEHTDYNDGFVLPMALERYTVIAATPQQGREVTIHNVTTGDTALFTITPNLKPGKPDWANYVKGVIHGFQLRKKPVRGFNAIIESDVPFGGGLASSAALAVATATTIEIMGGFQLAPREKALLCQEAEHHFANVPCGIMDPLIAILAEQDSAMLLDCRSLAVRPVPMRDPSVRVLIINTRVRHKNAESEYAVRRKQCMAAAKTLGVQSLRDATLPLLKAAKPSMNTVEFSRAHHVITENQRTLQAAAAAEKADWLSFGNLMYASHASLRDDYEVSSPELDAVVQIATGLGTDNGVLGCRMTGAGFGGSAVALVRTDALQDLIKRFSESYADRTGGEAEVFSTRPSAGVRLL